MPFRHRHCLDGTWQFQIDPANRNTFATVVEISHWREAQVPMPWQAQFDDLRQTSGTGWYRRTFDIDQRHTESAILHFNAVDYHTCVWVNGEKAGEHEGGYLPFELDVTHLLRIGENDLVVRVADPTDDEAVWPEFPFSQISHGKQSWYGPISGIWQSVWLEWRPAVHFLGLRLTPFPNQARLEISAQLSFTLANHYWVEAHLFAPDGSKLGEVTLNEEQIGFFDLDPKELQWWSPDHPALYMVKTTLYDSNGQSVDEMSATCGFRTIEAREGRLYLNGAPLYLRGALDQAYYPETIYTPPSLAFLEDQVRKAKQLGLNCLRCHIKIEDPRYYEVADRLGILIWTEIPNWALLTVQASYRAKETFGRMVERDWNHPSIIAWTLVNEDWGTDLTRNPEHRRWLAEFYHEARQIDPHRLIVDNSACAPNFHVAGDLEDYHHYRAIPDHADDWDAWVADFAGRAPWAWAADYLHERRADLPLIVSEFGNWGLPHPDQIQEQGRDPWWFETGHEWGEGIVYPHNMRERFFYWGLDRVFGDFDQFIHDSQLHMAHSLAYEISTMRLHPAIGGYVITEFTDVHWECNGLFDMQRNVKAGLADIFAPLNQDRVIVLRPQQWSGRPGDRVAVAIHTFDVDGPGDQGLVRWQAGSATGELPVTGGIIQLPLEQPGLVALSAQWLDTAGAVVAHNTIELACVEPASATGRVAVINDSALAATLAQLGYDVVAHQQPEPGERGVVLVARHYTPALQAALQSDARVLLLAGPDFNTASDTTRLPTGTVIPRVRTVWQGDWATSFSWLRKSGPFAALPGGPLLKMEYAEIMPDAVLAGIPVWQYRDHSWAGLALGWIHKPVSLLAKLPYGRGSLTITTFTLTADLLARNTIAQALMGGLVSLAGKAHHE
ncbi:MAG: glycoside hydrolase family 2 [Chloroflexi bacterium]|nr:MAG: glycoside hydrolase family 2 [Chloroflexota bacterium]